MSRARDLADLGGSADAGGLTGRNLIINGAMQVWQRGTGLTGSGYRIDRWYTEPRSGTTVTHDQSVDVPSGLGFSTSAHVYRSGGNDNGFHFNTNIELDATGNYSKFATGTKLVYSVYIKKAASAVQTSYNPYIYLNAGTGGSNSSQAVYSNEGAGTMTNGWQRMVFTFTCPTWTASAGSLSNVNCLVIRGIMGQDNTNQDIYITGAQLEVGDTATPFEHRSYGDELARCQRYYFRTTGSSTGYGNLATVSRIGNTIYRGVVEFPVTMRSRPSFSSSGSFQTLDSGFTFDSISGGDGASFNSHGVQVATTTNGSAGQSTLLRQAADGNAALIYDAEL